MNPIFIKITLGVQIQVIEIKSKVFKNKKLLECHKIIYDILDEQMKNGLHALRIKIIKN